MKKCIKCKENKDLSEFYRDKRRKDGLHLYCKTCNKALSTRWQKENPEKMRKHFVNHRLKDPVKWMLGNARRRAKAKGWDFDLDANFIESIIPERCPVFGYKLEWSQDRKKQANSPSIDRIDCSRGYTKDNVRILSFRANTLRNNASDDELIDLAYHAAKNMPLKDLMEASKIG